MDAFKFKNSAKLDVHRSYERSPQTGALVQSPYVKNGEYSLINDSLCLF